MIELSLPGFLQFKPDVDYQLGQNIAVGGAAVIYEANIFSDELKERAGRCSRCIAKVVKLDGTSLYCCSDFIHCFVQRWIRML